MKWKFEDGAWNPYLAGALVGLLAIVSAVATTYVIPKTQFLGASTTFVRAAGLAEMCVVPDHVAGNAYFTKEKVKPKDWDAAKMRFKRSHAGFQQANEYLDILEEKLRKAYRDYMNQGIVPTPSLLKSELLPEITVDSDARQAETTSMVTLFEEFIQSQIAKGIKHGTKKSYTTNLSRLKRYVVATGKPLHVDQYTNSIHQNVVKTLINLYNLQPNSIMDFCKQLKVFFNFCRSDKHIKLHQYHADIKYGFLQ